MSNDALNDRRKELEESFFRAQNEKLLEKLKADTQKEHDKEALKKVTGIADVAVLNRLVSLGIRVETLTAFTLYPLVEVAWADGSVDEKEKRAVLQAASQAGIAQGSVAYALVEGWLSLQPPKALHVAWFNYVKALCGQLTSQERLALQTEVLGRARAVAEASGGILGLGSKISATEAEVLTRLEDPFRAG